MAGPVSAEKKQHVFVPEGFTGFECGLCGECCRERARILVSAAKSERLTHILLESGFHVPVRDALMKDEDQPDAPAEFAMVGDRCVFLTDDARCHLHNIGVPELRGPWCVSFPVTPIVTPRGVNYSLSFACPGTAQILCRTTPLNIMALTLDGGQVPAASERFSSEHRIPVLGDRPPLDWAAHRLVEGMLLAIARDWNINLALRLTIMPIMLGQLLDGYEGPESNDRLRERVSSAGLDLPDTIKQARSIRRDRAAHYQAMAALIGRRIGLRSRPALRKLAEEAMRRIQGHKTRTDPARLGAALADFYAQYYRPRARRLEHILGNYVICRLFASREMLTGGVYKGVAAVAHLVALARFVAAAMACKNDKTVDKATLLEAIGLVEKLFAHGRNIFDFLNAADEQERMADPAYVSALVRI